MTRQFVLPDLGEGLTEAEIVAVLVREGDVIQEDAPLLEVETDKAQVEIPSPMGGRVDKIHVEPGQTVKVGAVLVTFADAASGTEATAPDPGSAAPRRQPPQRHRPSQLHQPPQLPGRRACCPSVPQRARSGDPVHPQAGARAGRRSSRGAAERAGRPRHRRRRARRRRASVHAAPARRRQARRRGGNAARPRRARATAAPIRAMGSRRADPAVASAPHDRRAHDAVGIASFPT